MKKAWFLSLILICMFSEVSLGQVGDIWGVASQVFYDRTLDRTFNMNYQTIGAKASAMGRASIAIAKDPTALIINPAGITQLRTISFSASGKFNIDSRKYEEPNYVGMKIVSDVSPSFSLNALSFAIPVSIGNRRLVAGLMYRNFNPMLKKIDNTQYEYGGGRIKEINDITGGSYTISPSVAVEIFHNYAIGTAYNFIYGESFYDLKIKSPYVDELLFFGYEDKEEYAGSFFDIGFFAAPLKWFSIGITLTPSWKYSITEKSEYYKILEDFSVAGSTYETVTIPEDSLDKHEIEIPLSVGVGIAVNPILSLTLAFDYRITNWTEAKLNGSSMKEKFVDVKSFYAGMEYRICYKALQIPLRLGYYNRPLPNKDCWFEDNYEGRQIKYDAFTVGIGIYKGAIEVDFAYEYGSREQKWWNGIGDYYNDRIFITTDIINQMIFSLTYKLNF